MRNIQTIFIIFILIFICENFTFSQTYDNLSNSQYKVFSNPDKDLKKINSGITTGEYYYFEVKKNHIYEWSTCGLNTFDTELSLFDENRNIKYSFNDDYCGLQSQISWKATYSGLVCVFIKEFNDSEKKPVNLKWREKSGG